MAEHFHTSPWHVDRMELWQVVACFIPARSPAEGKLGGANSAGQFARRPIRDIDLIKARYAAQAAGKPEPLHIFGVTDLAD